MKNNKSDSIPIREKICYGIGAMANEFQLTIIGTYLLIFFTDVMKIEPIIAGGVFLVGEICDAFTDIIITNIADKTETKWGKYRPWILFGIPLAAMLVLVFWYPDFLITNKFKIIWAYLIYIIMVPIFQTCFICPFITMNNVMSKDSISRLDFATFRTIGENLADILVNSLAMTIILSVGISFKDIRGWRVMAILFAVFMIIATIIGFLGTKERIKISNKDEQGNVISLKQKLSLYKGNLAAWKMLIITTAFYFSFSFVNIMFSYFCIYNLGHEEWVSVLSTIGIISQLSIVCLLPYLGRRLKERTLLIIGSIVFLIGLISCYFTNSFEMAIVYQILKGIGIGLIGSLIWSMWPEVADYTARIKGIAAPGIIMAVGTFFMKIGLAFSSFICSWILKLSNYNAALSIQSSYTLDRIHMCFVSIPMICITIMLIANIRLTEI